MYTNQKYVDRLVWTNFGSLAEIEVAISLRSLLKHDAGGSLIA